MALRTRRISSLSSGLGVALAAWATSLNASATLVLSGALTAGDVSSLATATGVSYGPAPSAHYYEPGPLTVPSGTAGSLYAGPAPAQKTPANGTVDEILVMLSLSPSSLAALGTITFDLKTTANVAVGTVTFDSGDFFTTAAAGLPSNISGMGNGQVNGIDFPGSLHAALSISGLGLGVSADTLLANTITTSPVDLRLDIFGVAPAESLTTTARGRGGAVTTTITSFAARIINNTPNSGALGITGKPPPAPAVEHVPDVGSTLGLLGLGVGLSALAARIGRRQSA